MMNTHRVKQLYHATMATVHQTQDHVPLQITVTKPPVIKNILTYGTFLYDNLDLVEEDILFVLTLFLSISLFYLPSVVNFQNVHLALFFLLGLIFLL
jgi:hypothetical protein